MPQDVSSPEKWQADYERGTDGWDLQGPTPVFKRLALERRFAPGRMIVPGTRRGFKLMCQALPFDSVPARRGREQLLVFQKTGQPN